MKLHEFITDPGEFLDPMRMRDEDDQGDCATDYAHKEKVPVRKKPLPSSNIEKARRIRTLARLKVKDTSAENEDTHHTSHIGGHGSAFLYR